ncbi:hypothetical protein [Mariniradius sediminis]|uniref:Flagellar motor switch protein FliN/FliY n=1 Tax=Mariniradius sediminis TaxID=2909237 RepID=A0ABS9BVP7_9BACT|nr:hypothetical protein [Mariniradius sediminis]MCF1751384.1 hypothetical protein [Mariniradius sediminis]
MENLQTDILESMDIDDIKLPMGIFVTIHEVLRTPPSEIVKINKDNVLVDGIGAYLMHVKRGDRKINVIRINMLQKINMRLDSAA